MARGPGLTCLASRTLCPGSGTQRGRSGSGPSRPATTAAPTASSWCTTSLTRYPPHPGAQLHGCGLWSPTPPRPPSPDAAWKGAGPGVRSQVGRQQRGNGSPGPLVEPGLTPPRRLRLPTPALPHIVFPRSVATWRGSVLGLAGDWSSCCRALGERGPAPWPGCPGLWELCLPRGALSRPLGRSTSGKAQPVPPALQSAELSTQVSCCLSSLDTAVGFS